MKMDLIRRAISDSIYGGYELYANVYSNTPNLKGSLAITGYNTLIEKLSSTIIIKRTSPFDFVSGYFTATEEGKGTIPARQQGNPGFVTLDKLADSGMLILICYTNIVRTYILVFQ